MPLNHRDADLADPRADWRRALEGAQAVVHLAALAHERAEAAEKAARYDLLQAVNAFGTERLARTAGELGVSRFVFTSTIGVCGDETFGTPFTEESRPEPRSMYARSKLEAEQRLQEVASATSLAVTVLRPTLVYGPGNAGNFLRLLRLVARAWPLPFASLRNRRNLTYVGNLASAIESALAREKAGALFLVCDSEALSTPELVAALAAGMRRPARQFPTPAWLLRALASAVGRPGMGRRLVGSLEVDNSKLRRELGWKPPFRAPNALRETAAWYAEAHGGMRRR